MKVLSVFGTRPEAIKLAPVVKAFEAQKDIEHLTCVTGQHRQMLDQVLALFQLRPKHDLNLMRPGQDLLHITQAALNGVTDVLRLERPDWVVVQGDTTTAFVTALAAFYEKVRVAHVEAGLRTGNRLSPWPEEINRRLITPLADLHFAPTRQAADHLLSEGISDATVMVTGNTVIDALRWTAQHADGAVVLNEVLRRHAPGLINERRRIVLVTLHRRENLGDPLVSICRGLARLLRRDDICIAFPVHMNPAVQSAVRSELEQLPGAYLLPPLEYLPFVTLLQRSHLVVTDSGGIQEEAPGLGKPVVVARDTTERPEALAAGTAVLAGVDGDQIADQCQRLLDDDAYYASMATAANPFGDGHASQRIVHRIRAEQDHIDAKRFGHEP